MYKRKRAGNTITRKINSTKDTAAKADKNHYISNSYLEGFIPIDTEYFTASSIKNKRESGSIRWWVTSAPAILALLPVFLMVAESQIFADSVMGIVDLLAATAGLQIDFNADIVNGYSQKAQANDLRIEGILLVEIC